MTLTAIIISIVCLVAGLVIGFLLSKSSLNSKAKFIVKDAKKTAENIIENANVKAEAIKKEKEAQAKVKFLELKSQHDENIQSREKKCKKQRKESETKNKN
jgi:ribonuclease Y